MDLEPALGAEQGGEQTDRARPGHEDGAGLPHAAPADVLDVLPRLGEHRGRLDEDAPQPERGRDGHEPVGVGAVAVPGEAVGAGDAVLGVPAVAAHVLLAGRAAAARHGVRLAHDGDDEVALGEPGPLRRLEDAAERLVAEDEPVLALGGLAVLPGEDLAVGAAHPDRDGRDEHLPLVGGRVVHLDELGGGRLAGGDGEGAHGPGVPAQARGNPPGRGQRAAASDPQPAGGHGPGPAGGQDGEGQAGRRPHQQGGDRPARAVGEHGRAQQVRGRRHGREVDEGARPRRARCRPARPGR